jgi:hypothetical protein
MTIVLTLECREALAGVEVDLKIFDGFERLRSGASTRYVLDGLTLPAGSCQLVAEYGAVPLNGGVLRPSVAIWRHGRSELMDWYEALPIPIAGVAASEGDLWWPPEYRVRPVPLGPRTPVDASSD